MNKEETRLVRINKHVWERLKELAGPGTSMSSLIEEALAKTYGGIYSLELDAWGNKADFILLVDAMNEIKKRMGLTVAPLMATTAIKKQVVPGERRKVGNRYVWFVDYSELASYCRKRQSRKDFETKDRQRRELKKLAELKEKYDKPIPDEG